VCAVAARLVVVLVAQLAIAGSLSSLRRPLWTDELVSYSQLAMLRGDRGRGPVERFLRITRSPDATPPLWLDRSLEKRSAVAEYRPPAPRRGDLYRERWYQTALDSWGWPRRLTLDELPSLERFSVVSPSERRAPRLPHGARVLFDVGRADGQLWYLRRRPPAADESAAVLAVPSEAGP
jgi:hypothetical protein